MGYALLTHPTNNYGHLFNNADLSNALTPYLGLDSLYIQQHPENRMLLDQVD
jgi:hypothetical protein